MVWQLNPLTILCWKCWDNEWAIFDVGSGQTFQMDTLTAIILMMVEAAACNLPEIRARLGEELLIPNNHELSDAISGILQQLEGTGLIEVTSQ